MSLISFPTFDFFFWPLFPYYLTINLYFLPDFSLQVFSPVFLKILINFMYNTGGKGRIFSEAAFNKDKVKRGATGSNVIIYLNSANSAGAGMPGFTSCP